jgi:hypothetical protein
MIEKLHHSQPLARNIHQVNTDNTGPFGRQLHPFHITPKKAGRAGFGDAVQIDKTLNKNLLRRAHGSKKYLGKVADANPIVFENGLPFSQEEKLAFKTKTYHFAPFFLFFSTSSTSFAFSGLT